MYIPLSEFRKFVEDRINPWARSISKRYRIEPDSFRIIIEQEKGPIIKDKAFGWVYGYEGAPEYPLIAKIANGRVVYITLIFPWEDKRNERGEEISFEENFIKSIDKLKNTTKRIFGYLSDPNRYQDDDMFNPLVISDLMHEYIDVGNGIRKWIKKKFDPFIVNGHHFREFNFMIETTKKAIIVHKKTGVSYELVDHNDRPNWDLKQECWIRCSELTEIKLEEMEEERRKSIPILLSSLDWIFELRRTFMIPTETTKIEKIEKIEKKKKSIFSQYKIRK